MNWKRSKFRTKQPPGEGLRVEALERRDCPAVSVSVFGDTLLVRGDANANVITITDNGKGAVAATIDGQSASGTAIKRILVLGGAGDDTLSYTLGGPLAGDETLLADLGQGNDSATLDYSQGVASGQLGVGITGGKDNDTITATSGPVAAGALAAFLLDGGEGDDGITLTSKGTVSGLLGVEAEGGAGNDSVTVTSGEVAAGGMAFFGLQGGKGDDSINFTSSAPVSGTLEIQANGGKGDDTVAVMSGAVAVGGSATFHLGGGKGDDSVNFTSSGPVNGFLRFTVAGGKGDDTIAADVTIDPGSTGMFRGRVLGGKGDDSLVFKITDNSVVNGVSGLTKFKAVIDGGSGDNTLTSTSNVTVAAHQIEH